MAPGHSTGHSDLYGLNCSMGPRLQQGHKLWPKLQDSVWFLVATRATDFKRNPEKKIKNKNKKKKKETLTVVGP